MMQIQCRTSNAHEGHHFPKKSGPLTKSSLTFTFTKKGEKEMKKKEDKKQQKRHNEDKITPGAPITEL